MKKLKQRDGTELKRLEFPFAVLLISGGHSQILVATVSPLSLTHTPHRIHSLVLVVVVQKDVGKYVILGTTLDDAIGEAYDKGSLEVFICDIVEWLPINLC